MSNQHGFFFQVLLTHIQRLKSHVYTNKRFRTRRGKTQFATPYQVLEPRQLLATVVANFINDFPSPNAPPTQGWQFQWNAPTGGELDSGAIDDPQTEFRSLQSTNTYGGWTTDGDRNVLSDSAGAFARLSKFGGHPGQGAVTPGSGVDRYSIASFTVSQSGHYQITDSFISLFPSSPNSNSDGVEYRVFVNRDQPLERGVVEPNTRAYFDTSLGFLKAGDTVHVAFGANGTHYSDFFTTDFNVTHSPDLEQTVGNFRNDFASSDSGSEYGWNYLWNAPQDWTGGSSGGNTVAHRSGLIGNSDSYVPLQQAQGYWTADGDLDGFNSSPDHFLRLNENGGQPGSGFQSSLLADRFVIAAFTVENSGIYGLADSFVSVASDSVDGVEVFVHLQDGSPLYRGVVAGGDTASFDSDLGYLKKGDTVYVAFGANGGHAFDRFETDFSVKRVLPRAAPDLGLLDHEGETISVNESQFGAIQDDHQDDRLAIQAALDYALVNDSKEVSFEAGTYNIGTDGLTDFESIFRLSRYDDLVVNGNGATLIVDSYTNPLFSTHVSTNIIFKGFTIDYAERVPANGVHQNDLYRPLTFTQGVISNLNHEDNTFTLTVNTDAFVAPDDSFTQSNSRGWGYALDPYVDGRLKTGSDWHYPTQAVSRGSSPGEFVINASRTDGLENGDRYIMQRRHNVAMFGFYNGSEDITVLDVTAYSAPSVFVGSLYSNSINVIDSEVTIRPNDRPSDPTAQRWKSINADGVHIQSSRVGAWIENSIFDGLGDDVMNFYTRPMTIYEAHSPTEFTIGVVVGNDITSTPELALTAGDNVTFYDPVKGEIIREAQIVSTTSTLIPSPTVPGKTITVQRVTIDQPVTGVVIGSAAGKSGYRNDTTIYNSDISKSFVVQDSVLSNSRRYGNFLMANDVHLVDNVYEGLSDEAIAAHNEPGWPLGLFADDVLIQGNEFSNIGFSSRYLVDDLHSGAIGIKAARFLLPDDPTNQNGELNQLVDSSVVAFNDIQIRDNVFYHWRKAAISVRNAQNVTIVGNTISTGLDNPLDLSENDPVPIDVHFTKDVSFESNTYDSGYEVIDSENNVRLEHGPTQAAGQNGLTSWIKFDRGAITRDSSGNGTKVTYDRPAISSEGRFYTSSSFDGANTVTLTQAAESETTQRTVSLWFNADDVNVDGKQVLFAEGNTTNGLNVYVEAGTLYVGGWAVGSFDTFLDTSVESGWNHVALVVDGSAGKIRGYLNGVKFQAGNASIIPAHGRDATVGRVGQSGTRFHAGQISSGSGNGLVGRIDDVRIYDRAVGDGEIVALFGRR